MEGYFHLQKSDPLYFIGAFKELTRIFHADLLRKPGSQMDAALDSHFDLDSMYTYSPTSKCSPTLPHQPSRPPRHDQYEISGLTRIFHTKSITACGMLIITALVSNCFWGGRDFIQPGITILHPPCTNELCKAPHDTSV
jgi:hypothetical protein